MTINAFRFVFSLFFHWGGSVYVGVDVFILPPCSIPPPILGCYIELAIVGLFSLLSVEYTMCTMDDGLLLLLTHAWMGAKHFLQLFFFFICFLLQILSFHHCLHHAPMALGIEHSELSD